MSTRTCLAALATALTVTVAGIGTGAAGTASAAAASGAVVRTPVAARATVRAGGPAAVAPTSTARGFVGIATELTSIPDLAGPADDPDLAFRQLLRNLSPDAPFLLRLGGVSGDDSAWPTPGVRKDPYLYGLTPRWGAGVRALLTAIGAKAILGVTLKLDPAVNTAVATTEVADFERSVGARLIDAFELGNEPEFYPRSVLRRRPHGSYRTGQLREKIADYGRKFSAVASHLGGLPLAGPSTGSPHWLPDLGAVLHGMPSRLKLVTIHAYPLKNCSPSAHVTVADFFRRSSIQGLADSVHGAVRAAAARGKPLRIDEMNGITCGGKDGFSNSFGEALWALNVLPTLWRAGVVGVNFQTINGDSATYRNYNQVITARHRGAGWRVSVEPVYYGLLAFARATPAGSRLLRVAGPGRAHLYRYAVRAPDGSERVVLTNVGGAARTIGVAAAGRRGTGSVSYLTASSLTARRGTTLGGQALSPRTGRLAGAARATRVRPNRHRVYAVRVPAHAAAILTLPG